MKFVQASEAGFGFEFNLREKQLLLKVLSLYPLIPATHHQLSRKNQAAGDENQKLLEESLAEHRKEARQKVRRFITNPKHFQAKGHSYLWTASRGELEWVLQVLNDVRVGSWLALGSPDLQAAQKKPPTPENYHHYWAMDVAGGFEMVFIAALSGDLPVQHD